MPDALVTLPDGTKAKITFTDQKQLDSTVDDLSRQHGKPQEGLANRVGKEAVGAGEAALNVATGVPAALGGGLAYAGTLLASGNPDAAKSVQEDTQKSLTYQPYTQAGQQDVQAVGNVLNAAIERPSEAAGDLARRGASSIGASPEASGVAGAAVKTGLQALPMAAGFKAGGEATTAASAAERTASAYVARSTGLDWKSVPPAIQKTLTAMAKRGEDLGKLDPKAVERVARAQSLDVPVPLTRGAATRNLADITREENVKLSDAGGRIREREAAQDTALHKNLAAVREQVAPGSKVKTSADAGSPVQSAARRKLQVMKGQSTRLYEEAREAGDMESPVSTNAIFDWLQDPANRANAGWIGKRLKAYDEHPHKGPLKPGEVDSPPILTINNLERVRQEANAKVAEGGTAGHYAAQAKSVIDQLLDNAGGDAYKKARASWKEWNQEFSRQKAIKDLTSEKAGMTDRRIALEGTTDYIIRADKESLVNVKDTLLKGGTEKTRARGEKAWKDLQAGVIQKLRETAAGKRGIRNEADQEQFNSTFLDQFHELDRSGKLEVLFGDKAAAKLRQIAQVTHDVRTKPAGRIAGSNTVPRMLSLMESVAASHIPLVKGMAKSISQSMEAKRAMGTPISDAAKANRKSEKPNLKRTLKDVYRRGSGAATQEQQ
jgi:hypothetical protein